MSASVSAAVPTLVIGGYLGSGKTTLVNHLLRHANGKRIAVMVNDFGEQVIDADLIIGADGDVLSLTGGCVCCSFGADLVGSLTKLAQREPAPDIILIETSGVGIPSAVARSARLAVGVRIEGIIGVCDATTIREQASHRHVGDTVRQQLADADLMLLNKTDLLDEATKQALHRWWHDEHPRTPIVSTVACAVDPAVALGVHALPGINTLGQTPRWQRAPSPAADLFASHIKRLDEPVDVRAIAGDLSAEGSPVVRAKGMLRDISGDLLILQLVGRRVDIHAAPITASAESIGQLLIITLQSPV